MLVEEFVDAILIYCRLQLLFMIEISGVHSYYKTFHLGIILYMNIYLFVVHKSVKSLLPGLPLGLNL